MRWNGKISRSASVPQSADSFTRMLLPADDRRDFVPLFIFFDKRTCGLLVGHTEEKEGKETSAEIKQQAVVRKVRENPDTPHSKQNHTSINDQKKKEVGCRI